MSAAAAGPKLLGNLVGPRAKEKIDEIPFVRLQPIQSICGNRSDIQSIDIGAIARGFDQVAITRNDRADQGGADPIKHL